MSQGFYHQNERDDAAGIGCIALLLMFVMLAALLGMAILVCSDEIRNEDGPVMDGSHAGANAVTKEELEMMRGDD